MQRFTPLRRGLTVGAALALQAFVGGCADKSTGPNDATNAHMVVTAAIAGTPIATLVVEVTGPGITQALAFNITATNGHASGVIRIPPGVNRRITVRAFDTNGDITHEGSKVIELVRPGANPDVSIPMVPQPGQIEIEVQIGNIQITLSQTEVNLGGGSVALLQATVTAANGDVLPAQVNWATTNPAAVRVETTGHVLGIWEGTAQVVATFAGVAAAANVTVAPCTITTYSFGTTVEGELTPTDCRRLPNPISNLTGRLIDYYSVSTSVQRAVQFDMTAGFDPWLWQLDGNRAPIAWNDDFVGLQSQFRMIVAPGEYLLGAAAYSGGSGAYSMATTAISQDNGACGSEFFVMPGVTTQQALVATDCGAGTLDRFHIALNAGQTVTVRMNSSAFNTFLRVAELTNDDFPGAGTNSEITYIASFTQKYTIEARSTGGTGNYTLIVQ